MMGNMTQLLSKVIEAANGKISDDDARRLARQVEGAVGNVPIVGRGIAAAAKRMDWDTVEGGLRNYIDVQIVSSSSTTVTARADASASATVSISQTFDVIDHGTLPDDDKAAVKQELVAAENEARQGRIEKFGDAVVRAAEKAGKCSNSLSAVLAFLAEAAKMLPPQG